MRGKEAEGGCPHCPFIGKRPAIGGESCITGPFVLVQVILHKKISKFSVNFNLNLAILSVILTLRWSRGKMHKK